MTTRWYPAMDTAVLQSGALTQRDLDAVRAAGFELCAPREECPVHPGEPEACYLCL